MRTKLTIAFVALILAAPSVLAQAKQTITGTVTDSMCGAHHMMKNKTAAECTRECVKQGSDFALASNDKVYTLKGDKAQFDKYAGQTVKIKRDDCRLRACGRVHCAGEIIWQG
uniref:Uncharacterized protein n=1 Tax=mine drainage metagenome TaxID=410659 RepID=E6PXW3_9ZZZZ